MPAFNPDKGRSQDCRPGTCGSLAKKLYASRSSQQLRDALKAQTVCDGIADPYFLGLPEPIVSSSCNFSILALPKPFTLSRSSKLLKLPFVSR